MSVTEIQRELAGVIEEIATAVDKADVDGAVWCEELIPPMGDDPDEVVEGTVVTRGGGYDHAGDMAGMTLWRGDVAYRVIVSKIPL